MVADLGITVELGREVGADDLSGFDEVIIATGVTPRDPQIPGQDRDNVVTYIDVLRGKVPVGKRVAVIGAGGIGFDVSEYLVHEGTSPTEDLPAWMAEWGVSDPGEHRGGLAPEGPQPEPAIRQVTLLQRKAEKPGKRLGKTTGWIHRAALQKRHVHMLSGCEYLKIDDAGLHLTINGEQDILPVDNIIICAGQTPCRELEEGLKALGQQPHLIGGADVAAELDAKRAIDQGLRLAVTL